MTPNGTYPDDYPNVLFGRRLANDIRRFGRDGRHDVILPGDCGGFDGLRIPPPVETGGLRHAVPHADEVLVTLQSWSARSGDFNHGAFTGLVGVQIQVGASPVTVRTLGRLVAPGNGKSHAMTILDTSNNVIGTATISAGGTEGTFVYTALDGGPATLTAGTTYFVVSAEDNTNGGDSFWDVDSTVNTTSVAAIAAAVTKVTGATTFSQGAGANHDPGPLDFQY